MEIFVLQHTHVLDGDREDVKLIGVYSSDAAAREAAARAAVLPGFADFPSLLSVDDDERDGFEITAYGLDKDEWTEGFFTSVSDD